MAKKKKAKKKVGKKKTKKKKAKTKTEQPEWSRFGAKAIFFLMAFFFWP